MTISRITRRISPLELVHPDAAAKRVLVLGSACPAFLHPGKRSTPGHRNDLVVLAPTRSEARTRGWLDEAARTVAGALAGDGVAYVLAPRGSRREAVRVLEAQGLVVEATIAHVPDAASSRYLVPLVAGPANYALSSLIPIRSWKRRLASLALSGRRGRRLLAGVMPSVGFAVRRSGARPLFDWLFMMDDEVTIRGSVVLTTSWRSPRNSFVLHRFAEPAELPQAVAKITSAPVNPADRPAEAMILGRLAAGARTAGAEVPELRMVARLDPGPVMLESALPGRSAAAILRDKPRRLPEVQQRVAAWIENWNRITATTHVLTEERLARELVAPARRLAHLLEEGDAYADRVEADCSSLVGTPVALVAAHNDLTMSNLLLGESGSLGVVDWDTAREDSLPLVDFYYAVVDAAAAAISPVDHLRAFRSCLVGAGKHAGEVRALEERLSQALGLSVATSDLCFHACWLHHAANEHQMDTESTARPFLSILRVIASDASVRSVGAAQ